MIVQRRYGLLRFASVENIPLQAERHSGGRQELFAFPPESAFTFRPECCSESQRNGVRLQTGIAFTFDRIPQKDLRYLFFMVGCPEMSQDRGPKESHGFCMHFACSNRRYIRYVLFVRSINQ